MRICETVGAPFRSDHSKILGYLMRSGPTPQKKLEAVLGVSKASVSRRVSELVTAKLILSQTLGSANTLSICQSKMTTVEVLLAYAECVKQRLVIRPHNVTITCAAQGCKVHPEAVVRHAKKQGLQTRVYRCNTHVRTTIRSPGGTVTLSHKPDGASVEFNPSIAYFLLPEERSEELNEMLVTQIFAGLEALMDETEPILAKARLRLGTTWFRGAEVGIVIEQSIAEYAMLQSEALRSTERNHPQSSDTWVDRSISHCLEFEARGTSIESICERLQPLLKALFAALVQLRVGSEKTELNVFSP